MGDFNDTPESAPIRAIIGEPPFALFELLPVDSQGRHDTYYWKYHNELSRIDYLITSPGMADEYVPDSARIADVAGWDKASDHRAIYAKFYAREVPTAAPPEPAKSSQSRSSVGMAGLALSVGIAIVIMGINVFRQRRPPRP